ncbi:MAG: hypothetical protein HN350_08145 [Phycisphaerales bacterium]|nr:hypothetical protein [Phycisphaerales bacterium]
MRTIEIQKEIMDILTEDQKEELDRRLDAYHQNPDRGSSWETVRQRIMDRAH